MANGCSETKLKIIEYAQAFIRANEAIRMCECNSFLIYDEKHNFIDKISKETIQKTVEK